MKLDLKMYDRFSVVSDAIEHYVDFLKHMVEISSGPEHEAAHKYYSGKLTVALKIKEELNEV